MELPSIRPELSNRVYLPRAYGAWVTAKLAMNTAGENTFQIGCSNLATSLELAIKYMLEYCGIEVRKTYSLSSLMTQVPAESGLVAPTLREYFQFRLDTVSSWYLGCKYNMDFFAEHSVALDILEHALQLLEGYSDTLMAQARASQFNRPSGIPTLRLD